MLPKPGSQNATDKTIPLQVKRKALGGL